MSTRNGRTEASRRRGICKCCSGRSNPHHCFHLIEPSLQPTPTQSQPPPQLLDELRDILVQRFRTEFDSAADRKDEQGVSRFFRLWPGIGAETEGLEAYGDFVVGLVKARSSSAGKRESGILSPSQL